MRVIITLFVFCGAVASFGGEESTRYDAIVKQMQDLAVANPHVAQVVTLGPNDQGIKILGLRIERPETFDGEKAKHLLVGTHHGNEEDAAPLSLAFATELVNIFTGGKSLYKDHLANRIYYVFPVLNIFGYNQNSREEKDAAGQWHDPNRDYPDPCIDNRYFKLRSTALIAQFIDTQKIVSAVTIHGYVGTFTYPWGFYTEDPETPDHHFYHALLSYSVEVNNYRIGTHKDVIYPASGTFEDWAYHDHGVWVALLEVSWNPDYEADVELLMRFFVAVPQTRSSDHAHYGQCSEIAISTMDGRSNRGRP